MKKHPILDFLQLLCLFIAFFFFGNGKLTNTSSNAVYYFPYLLCLVSLGLSLLFGEKKVSGIVFYRLAFILFTILSMFYAIHFDFSFIGVKTAVLASFPLFAVAFECMNRKNGIEKVGTVLILATACNDVYVLTRVDLKKLAELGERLGQTSVGTEWNANSIGLSAFYAFALTFYLWRKKCKETGRIKNRYSLLAIPFSALFLYVVILSGSRKALLGVAILLGLYVFCTIKASLFTKAVAVAVLGTVSMVALYRIPFLYQAIGYRFDSLFAFFGIGNATADTSVSTRVGMVEFGLRQFPNRPFLGNGINCYQVLYGEESGWTVYAHNNYIELLVDGGLIGLVAYYLFPVRKLFQKAKGSGVLFFRILLLTLLILDVGMVSYNEPLTQIMMTLSVCAIDLGAVSQGDGQKAKEVETTV